jgi:hypothetical protein
MPLQINIDSSYLRNQNIDTSKLRINATCAFVENESLLVEVIKSISFNPELQLPASISMLFNNCQEESNRSAIKQKGSQYIQGPYSNPFYDKYTVLNGSGLGFRSLNNILIKDIIYSGMAKFDSKNLIFNALVSNLFTAKDKNDFMVDFGVSFLQHSKNRNLNAIEELIDIELKSREDPIISSEAHNHSSTSIDFNSHNRNSTKSNKDKTIYFPHVKGHSTRLFQSCLRLRSTQKDGTAILFISQIISIVKEIDNSDIDLENNSFRSSNDRLEK